MVESFQRNICRTCLRKISSSDSIGIFSEKQFYANQTLSQVLVEITHTLMDSKEMLPVNVCLNCAEKLKRMASFKKTIEKADRTLRCKLRVVEMRHCMRKMGSITSALDAICGELNEISDEFEASNKRRIIDKPTEISTKNTTSNVKRKPVNINQVRLWQQDIDSIVNRKTSFPPLKSNSTVKIVNKTLNRVKEMTPYSIPTNSKIKKPVNNWANSNKSTNTNELNINLQNKKPQHVQKPGKTFSNGKPLMDKNTDNFFNQLIKPEISKDYPAESSNIKSRKRTAQNNSATVSSNVINSKMSDTIIIIDDTGTSDICNIIQVVQDQPIVEISDEEEASCNDQKIDLGPQKPTHNFEKRSINLNQINSKAESDSDLKKAYNLAKELCSVNKEQSRFEEELSWINHESSVFQNPATFAADPDKLSCDKCDKKFTAVHLLQRHLLYHSLNLEVSDKPAQPTGCRIINVADVYKRAEEIRSSYKKTKTELQPIIDVADHTYRPTVSKQLPRSRTLDHCPAPFDLTEVECKYCRISMQQVNLHKHILRAHMAVYKKELKKFVRGYYKCNECPPGYKNVPQMLNHMTAQHRAKFQCNHCDKNFTSRTPLVKHLRKSHGIKPTSLCYICGKIINVATLSVHLKSHTTTKSIKPPDRYTRLKRKSSLTDIHENEKPFICEHCGKRFTCRKSLSDHVRAHSNVLPYTCVICNKSFIQPSRLANHLVSHQHAKPYACPVCPHAFSRQQSLKQHCVKCHPEHELIVNPPKKLFECTLCQRNFAYDYTLKKHTRIFHPQVYFSLKRKQLSKDSAAAEITDPEELVTKFLN